MAPGKKKKNNDLGYVQAANVERRTWDTEKYEARAAERRKGGGKIQQSSLSNGNEDVTLKDEDEKEEFRKANDGRAKPMFSKRAFLKARSEKVDLESKLHTREIISVEEATVNKTDGVTKTASGAGWYCKVCDCILKDSMTYLDHINGRKHQRALGYSMRTEKSTLSDVQERLSLLKRKREEEDERKRTTGNGMKNDEPDLEASIEEKDEEITRRRAERKRKKEEKKKAQEEEVEYEAELDPGMAAMMGFSGFGTTK